METFGKFFSIMGNRGSGAFLAQNERTTITITISQRDLVVLFISRSVDAFESQILHINNISMRIDRLIKGMLNVYV